MIVFMKEFLRKVDFEKKSADNNKSLKNYHLQNYVSTVTVYSIAKQTYCLLISFANNLNPDHTRHSVGLGPGTLMFYLKTLKII